MDTGFILTSAKEKPSTDKATVDKAAAQKILRSVPYEQGFHFASGSSKNNSETAINLFSFYEELTTIESKWVKFHFQRRDFQNWIETTLGDQELASRIDKTLPQLTDEELKKKLLKTLQARLTELQTVSNIPSKQTISGEELKKFNVEELKQYNGQAGKTAYLTFEGKVYDVTDSNLWQGGNHMSAHQAGKDLTEAIKSAPHGTEVLSKMKQVGVLT